MAKKSAGKVALISPIEVEVMVGLDMAEGFIGGLVAGGMMVAGLTGVVMCTGMLGVVEGVTAASRGFSGFGLGMMSSGF